VEAVYMETMETGSFPPGAVEHNGALRHADDRLQMVITILWNW
jgi:hypothetical protein